MTQHKEECEEDEEGNPEIISGMGMINEGEVEVQNSKKDASEAPLSKAKRESLNEEVCDTMEEKEKEKK
eukprot:2580980-Ditylum_brightwellii.AAC.1